MNFLRNEKAVNPATILFTENQINTLGYEYLGNNLFDEAIILFQFNVEEFPESFNVNDSLGEAHMKDRNYKLAVYNYKKSLELNSENNNAEKSLDELYKLIGDNSENEN